jgi:hypothetical protein
MSAKYDYAYGKDYHNDYEKEYERDYEEDYEKDENEECMKDCHEDCRREYHSSCKKEHCENVKGNAFDIEFKKRDCEVRADIVVGREKRCIRLWGQVKDCDGRPVEDALVKLLKPYYRNGRIEFEGVAHTKTDCLGFYQFEICPEEEHVKFRVIVSKATRGHERKIEEDHGICNPCRD